MSVLAGLAAVPVQAVSPDCDDEFDIADSQALASTRELDPDEEETGVEDVLALTGDENVTVQLLTDDAVLEFGIFQLDGSCARATTVSPVECESDETLDTEPPGVDPTLEKTCVIQAPGSGSEDYYFHMKNVGDVTLDYKIFRSA